MSKERKRKRVRRKLRPQLAMIFCNVCGECMGFSIGLGADCCSDKCAEADLPLEFERSILGSGHDLSQKSSTLVGALYPFATIRPLATFEGNRFWSLVVEDIIYGREIKPYKDYLTKDSDMKAVAKMQGWDVGRVEADVDKGKRVEVKGCAEEPELNTDPEGLVSDVLGYVKALEAGYIKEKDFIKLVRERVG